MASGTGKCLKWSYTVIDWYVADPAKDPSADVLKVLLCDGCPAVIGREPIFTHVTNGLIGKGVIELADATNITTQHNLANDKRGSELVRFLIAKYDESSDPLEYINDICAVFESRDVNNAFLKRKAAEIKKELKPISEYLTIYISHFVKIDSNNSLTCYAIFHS